MPITRNYLSLALDHWIDPSDAGYSYVLLPGKTSAQVSSYAASPDISIVENSAAGAGRAREHPGITGISFWTDEPTAADGVTSDKKSSS